MTPSERQAWLPCPDCDVDAVPSSATAPDGSPMWTEADTGECPSCHRMVRATLTGDTGGDEYMDSCFVDEDSAILDEEVTT